jgi:hypothetical protein
MADVSLVFCSRLQLKALRETAPESMRTAMLSAELEQDME